jgi:hypothetical protein
MGKTTLAAHIAEELHCSCLHLDSFLVRGRGNFFASLDFDTLRFGIDREKQILVIEGVCLLAVFERLALAPDYLIFVDDLPQDRLAIQLSPLENEVESYIRAYSPQTKANSIITRKDLHVTSSYDVDIAYIKSKTIVSVTLAIGGLFQTIAGVLLLNAGLSSQGTAYIKMIGVEISATGLGGIILSTSVIWAYFAYRARPKFSSHNESRITKHADGASETYEVRSSTAIAISPEEQSDQHNK